MALDGSQMTLKGREFPDAEHQENPSQFLAWYLLQGMKVFEDESKHPEYQGGHITFTGLITYLLTFIARQNPTFFRTSRFCRTPPVVSKHT